MRAVELSPQGAVSNALSVSLHQMCISPINTPFPYFPERLSLALLLSHFLPLLQAQVSSELGSSIGDCPRSSAHTPWPQFSFWSDERAPKVPSYLLKKCGLISWEQCPQTSVMKRALGQSSCHCGLHGDLAHSLLLHAPVSPPVKLGDHAACLPSLTVWTHAGGLCSFGKAPELLRCAVSSGCGSDLPS